MCSCLRFLLVFPEPRNVLGLIPFLASLLSILILLLCLPLLPLFHLPLSSLSSYKKKKIQICWWIINYLSKVQIWSSLHPECPEVAGLGLDPGLPSAYLQPPHYRPQDFPASTPPTCPLVPKHAKGSTSWWLSWVFLTSPPHRYLLLLCVLFGRYSKSWEHTDPGLFSSVSRPPTVFSPLQDLKCWLNWVKKHKYKVMSTWWST